MVARVAGPSRSPFRTGPSSTAASRRLGYPEPVRTSKSLVGGLFAVVLTTGVGGAPAGAAVGADPAAPTSTPPATVAAPGAPESTTSTVVAVMPPAGGETAGEEPLTDSERAARALRWITIGLAALGLFTAAAEVVFWRRTDPARLLAQEAAQVGTVRLAAATGPPVAPSAWSTAPVEPPVAVPVGAAEGAGGLAASADAAVEKADIRQGAFSEPFVMGEVDEAVVPTGFFGSADPAARRLDAGSGAGHGMWASSGWDEPADDAATSEESTEEGTPRVQRPNRRQPLNPRGYFDSPGANPFRPKD